LKEFLENKKMLNQSKQQAELHKQLWSIADELRGNMDASEFKDFILSIIFYRYLSENLVKVIEKEYLNDDKISYTDAWKKKEIRDALIEELTENSDIGYLIEPDFLFSNLVNQIKQGRFDISVMNEAIKKLGQSTQGKESQDDFDGLFEDMDLNSNKLGKGEKERSEKLGKIILKVADIDFSHEDAQIDVLGDAYEYLIGQFAANAGKKAGEFYTPQAVSEILARIVTLGKKEIKDVYDPTCGSGSLLLRLSQHAKVGKYYGQELNSTTYNLARMNMMLHKVPFNKFDIYQGDTLENPCDRHEQMKFEAVVANPPYSAKWNASEKFLQDERFSAYGKLAPTSKADYAFVQHMIHHLSDSGTMAVVLPHGVLFRGGAEEMIRKYLVKEKNYLEAVIGLADNLFYGTTIPTTILIFKKCKEDTNILFIDASKDFSKQKKQNVMMLEHIERIVETYKNRKDVDKYAHVATLKEIEENEYNLNIPRYVDNFEKEEPIDIEAARNELKTLNKEIEETKKEINKYLKELGEPELE
jgi:type I restriction enzyme M protein